MGSRTRGVDRHTDAFSSLVARDRITGPFAALALGAALLLGFAGGMVPSPSALVVLPSGVALGRAGSGEVLAVAYRIGMALALMLAGLLLVRGRELVVALSRRWEALGTGPLGGVCRALAPAS